MGGHGGLNILPQKRWNVYNFDNREKVRRDEEAADRDDQLKREQSRRRDSEFRLERLRQARGLQPNASAAAASASTSHAPATATAPAPVPVPAPAPAPAVDSGHFSLFDGVADFSSLAGSQEDGEKNVRGAHRFRKSEDEDRAASKKRRKEEKPVVTPEDEKYKLGYGLAGKGVKAPWYLAAPSTHDGDEEEETATGSRVSASRGKNNDGGKKTIEQLREERRKREKQENERERAILASAARKKGSDRGFSRRAK